MSNTWILRIAGGLLALATITQGGVWLADGMIRRPLPTPPIEKETQDSIEFRLSDDGAVTASNYIRAYCRNLAAASKKTAEQIRNTNDDSMKVYKDFAAATEIARKEATKGLDARVAALIKSEPSREDWAKFHDEFVSAFERLGK